MRFNVIVRCAHARTHAHCGSPNSIFCCSPVFHAACFPVCAFESLMAHSMCIRLSISYLLSQLSSLLPQAASPSSPLSSSNRHSKQNSIFWDPNRCAAVVLPSRTRRSTSSSIPNANTNISAIASVVSSANQPAAAGSSAAPDALPSTAEVTADKKSCGKEKGKVCETPA